MKLLFSHETPLLQKFPIGEEEHVELIHDKLAEIINGRKVKEDKIKRNSFLFFTLLFYFIPAGYIIWNLLLKILECGKDIMNLTNPYGGTYVWYEYFKNQELFLPCLLISRIFAGILLIYYISFVIPREVCKWFNGEVSNKTLLCIGFSFIVALLLFSHWIVQISFKEFTGIFVILGWFFLWLIYILANQRKSSNQLEIE